MNICSKQWVAINFCVWLGKDICEMCVLLREAFGKECFAKQTIQYWHKSSRNGRQETSGLPHASWPHSSIIEVNVNMMEECISNRGHSVVKNR